MNILVLCVDAFPKMGGVSTMAHHLCAEFSNLGHTCIFLGPQGTYIPDDYDRNYIVIEDFESNIKHRENAKGRSEDARIEELLNRIVDEYHIEFILNVHPFYYGVGVCNIGERRRIPTGTYFHGFEFRSQTLRGFPGISQSLAEPNSLPERTVNVALRSSHVYVNSHYTRSLIAEVRKSEIVVTGCGLETDVVAREISSGLHPKMRSILVEQTTEFSITYIGRLVPSKRVDRVLHIIADCPTFTAIIVGDGPERERLMALASELNIANRCIFKGLVSESEKFEILRATDFIALLSERNDETGNVEGFGISLLEGAACGAIPVTSGTGGMVDIVSNPGLGLLVDDNDSIASSQLLSLSKSKTRMDEISQNIRAKIVSDFNWRRVCEKVLEVLI